MLPWACYDIHFWPRTGPGLGVTFSYTIHISCSSFVLLHHSSKCPTSGNFPSHEIMSTQSLFLRCTFKMSLDPGILGNFNDYETFLVSDHSVISTTTTICSSLRSSRNLKVCFEKLSLSLLLSFYFPTLSEWVPMSVPKQHLSDP